MIDGTTNSVDVSLFFAQLHECAPPEDKPYISKVWYICAYVSWNLSVSFISLMIFSGRRLTFGDASVETPFGSTDTERKGLWTFSLLYLDSAPTYRVLSLMHHLGTQD